LKTITFDETAWQLSPLEPTDRMLSAGDAERPVNWHRQSTPEVGRDVCAAVYRAMMGQAPRTAAGIEPNVDALTVELARIAHQGVEDGKMRHDIGLLLIAAVHAAVNGKPA
jgi:hypothetical protein